MSYEPAPSKLSPPRIKAPLIRKRLLRQINGCAERKMTIIRGRAAQGKTTLAANYVARSEIPFAWLNLGPEDSDPAGFYRLLVRALGPYLPEASLPQLLAYPSLNFGPREAMPLYREWSKAVFDRLVGPLHIVFDGADQIPADAPSWQLFQAMVEALAEGVHLLVLSRRPPPSITATGPSPARSGSWRMRTWRFPLTKRRPFFAVTAGLNFPKRRWARCSRSRRDGSGG